MERLGVSERDSYDWSSPIWGHQYPCKTLFHPPICSSNTSIVKEKQKKEKKEEKEDDPKKELTLHD